MKINSDIHSILKIKQLLHIEDYRAYPLLDTKNTCRSVKPTAVTLQLTVPQYKRLMKLTEVRKKGQSGLRFTFIGIKSNIVFMLNCEDDRRKVNSTYEITRLDIPGYNLRYTQKDLDLFVQYLTQ